MIQERHCSFLAPVLHSRLDFHPANNSRIFAAYRWDGAFLSYTLAFWEKPTIRLFSKAFQRLCDPNRLTEFLNINRFGQMSENRRCRNCAVQKRRKAFSGTAKQNHGVHWYGHLWDSMQGTWDGFNKESHFCHYIQLLTARLGIFLPEIACG